VPDAVSYLRREIDRLSFGDQSDQPDTGSGAAAAPLVSIVSLGPVGVFRTDDERVIAAAAVSRGVDRNLAGSAPGAANRRLIEYLKEERGSYREARRQSPTDRCRASAFGATREVIGRKALGSVASVATPDTIIRWYRELVAKKYDGSQRRGPGRPRTATEVVRLVVEMATQNHRGRGAALRGAVTSLKPAEDGRIVSNVD